MKNSKFPVLDPNGEDDENDAGPEAEVKSEPDDDNDGSMGFLSSRLPKEYGDGDDEDDDRLEEDSEDDDIEPVAVNNNNNNNNNNNTQKRQQDDTNAAAVRANADPEDTSDPRQQFFDGMRHLPVSYPYLSPDLNAHVWESAGREMPLIHTNVRDHRDRDVTHILDAMPRDDDEEAEYREAASGGGGRGGGGGGVIPFYDVNHHPGAGAGVIGSAGTSLNHVVAIEWSPSGLGKNSRPVLAVLTGCGSLAVYGEGCASPFGNTARPFRSVATKGTGAVRDLASWIVLWAVGENFVVPGQEEYGYGEFIKAFAWSQGAGDGKALLGYMNDQREVVILCVGTEYRKTKDGLDEAVWNVQEMCRFEAEGPHGEQALMDPDFVPGGSSFCMRWGPWIKGEETWTCVLSYMDRNYIGFRRITLDVPAWKPTEAPKISCDPHDWDGRCLHLGADAFLEFENTIWTVGDRKICRGYIATPLVAEPFEVDLARSNPYRPKPGHSTEQCDTSYDHYGSITNPITGLIVHPVSLQTVSPSLVPFYTAVRLSATATNQGWWETNLVKLDNDGKLPQWATEIQEKISSVTPLGLAGLTGDDEDDDGEDDGDDGADQVVEGGGGGEEGEQKQKHKTEEWDDSGGDDDDEDDEDSDDDDDEDGAGAAYQGPDVHPLRMRIWGLAVSPGGGTTAVLASQQLTQKPERGGWHNHRSRVMFDHHHNKGRRPLRRKAQVHGGGGIGGGPMDLDGDEEAGSSTVNVDNLTTEARLWEWMYGGGPGVPGITHYPEPTADSGGSSINRHKDDNSNNPGRAQEAKDALAQARRDRIKEVFKPFVRDQTCSICADGTSKFPDAIAAAATATHDGRTTSTTRRLDCACEHGHRVALCGASGLAILEPGTSRCCGVCRSRCLDVDVLLGRVLLPAGRTGEAEMVGREVRGDRGPESREEGPDPTPPVHLPDDAPDGDVPALGRLQPRLDRVDGEHGDPHGDARGGAGTRHGREAELAAGPARVRVQGRQPPLDVLVGGEVGGAAGAVPGEGGGRAAEDGAGAALGVQLADDVEPARVPGLLAGLELLVLDLEDDLDALEGGGDGGHGDGGEEAGGGDLADGERGAGRRGGGDGLDYGLA
ncbi:hypothetical protein VMCG_05012 [Cytospora schulzeri]|uniref:Transcription factor IIIC 90kDa subunit N-terminal domain-containing protein n=1 Tax=Cytospora schulzeri TaxID=448051 RepID=A0A423WM11_9PEZI|nr:hypothetical protein VMCG_05012 [Valsa malicola]